jgi:hypothetical protein
MYEPGGEKKEMEKRKRNFVMEHALGKSRERSVTSRR